MLLTNSESYSFTTRFYRYIYTIIRQKENSTACLHLSFANEILKCATGDGVKPSSPSKIQGFIVKLSGKRCKLKLLFEGLD